MDPFCALGVAAAVIQFVDFGARIVGSAREIHNAAEGALQQNIVLEDIITDFRSLSERIETNSHQLSLQRTNKSEVKLNQIAARASTIAKELLAQLQELKVNRNAQFQSWEALRKALKAARAADKIRAMQDQIDDLRSEIMLHLVLMTKDDQASFVQSIRQLDKQCQQMRIDQLNHISRLEQGKLADIQKEVARLGDILNQANSSLHQAVRSPQRQPAQSTSPTIPTSVTTDITQLVFSILGVSKITVVLDSLKFDEMPLRHSEIADTYQGTCSWIFNPTCSAFPQWLESSDDLFWVSGKAGSGKSTLMKQLTDNPRTRKALQSWAKNKELHLASFFFWNSGYPMQKSQKGLLQSLLHQIFSIKPNMIEKVCPEHWKAIDPKVKKWTKPELKRCLESALTLMTDTDRVCFFIDGLDEYDEDEDAGHDADDHYALIKFIDRLQDLGSAKFCVSSRPWNVFVTHYGSGRVKTIRMEDMNASDMDKYIKGKLESDDRFLRLAARDTGAPRLAQEIRERANGVFLWVYFVVRSLLRGLNEPDGIADLQRRLEALPPDLERYFHHILNGIDDAYRVQTSRALLLAVTSDHPLPYDVFYHLEHDMENPNFAINTSVHQLRCEKLDEMRTTVATFLNKWCRDLVELSTSYDGKVDFLHRSVKDFLTNKDIKKFLVDGAGEDFNPRLSLCRSYLAQLKYLLVHGKDGDMALTQQMLYFAREYERHDAKSPIAELDELGRVAKRMSVSKPVGKVISVMDPSRGEAELLPWLVACDMQLYVRHTLERHPERFFQKRTEAPLIDYVHIDGLSPPPTFAKRMGGNPAMEKLLNDLALAHDKKLSEPPKSGRRSMFGKLFRNNKNKALEEMKRGTTFGPNGEIYTNA